MLFNETKQILVVTQQYEEGSDPLKILLHILIFRFPIFRGLISYNVPDINPTI